MTGTLFIFLPNYNCTTSSPFLATALCHLSDNFPFHRPTALLPLAAQLFQAPSAVFHGTEISLHWEIRDTELNGHAKVQFLVSTADESWLRGQAGTVSHWSPNRNVRSHLILKLPRLLLQLCQQEVHAVGLAVMGQHMLRITPRSTSYRTCSVITT